MITHPTAYEYLLAIREEKGAGFIVLIDPDKLPLAEVPHFAALCTEAGVDAFFLGGSLIHATGLDAYVETLKAVTPLPVIGFPGSLSQVSGVLDAILYLSVISGRDPHYLFGQHVIAAPILRRLGLEPIATGYMLVESGALTTAQYMSNSMPLPRRKPEIAVATGLAAEMMGMQILYTDAGSGAQDPVPEEIIYAVSQACRIPLIVGGGLRSPQDVSRKVEAGAGLVVVGNAIEHQPDAHYIAELVAATHIRVPQPLKS